MIILGIESSHDDTSVAILEHGKVKVLKTFSQIEIHAKYGGTIPEIASREHVNNVALVLEELKQEYDLNQIDLVAYTAFPGLIGSLQVGFLFANAIALSLNKPLFPVNHLEGHVFSAAIDEEIVYPHLALLVSGGHTQLIYKETPYSVNIIGETSDDAVGEVYDKVARKLNLGFPGGPLIDKINLNDFVSDINFSIPKTEGKYDFSLSGIKTQVINLINKYEMKNEKVPVEKIAYAFQKTIIKYLIQKTQLAIEEYQPASISLVGGVSANKELRTEFLKLHPKSIVPNLKYCTDNGAMIAKAAQIYNEKNK